MNLCHSTNTETFFLFITDINNYCRSETMASTSRGPDEPQEKKKRISTQV